MRSEIPADVMAKANALLLDVQGAMFRDEARNSIATALIEIQEATARECVEWHLTQMAGYRDEPQHPELDTEAQARVHECSARLLAHKFGLDPDAISRRFLFASTGGGIDGS